MSRSPICPGGAQGTAGDDGKGENGLDRGTEIHHAGPAKRCRNATDITAGGNPILIKGSLNMFEDV